MSCIIFGYRRFYAIICKITHFFYPKRKNPPLFAHSTLHKAKLAAHRGTEVRQDSVVDATLGFTRTKHYISIFCLYLR